MSVIVALFIYVKKEHQDTSIEGERTMIEAVEAYQKEASIRKHYRNTSTGVEK